MKQVSHAMPLTVGERSLLCTTSECIYYASQDNTHSRLCWTWPKWPTSVRRPEKDVLFLLVFVHHQEFLLFRVEETDNVVKILPRTTVSPVERNL